MGGFFDKVYRLVSLVPTGRVVSYGQVAAWLGEPRAARAVGWALHGLPPGSGVPWHRVINGEGRISNTRHSDGATRQRDLLEAEGIVFDADGRLDMAIFRWQGPSLEELDAIWNDRPLINDADQSGRAHRTHVQPKTPEP